MNSDSRIVVFDLGGVLIDWDPRYLFRKVFDGDSARMETFLREVRFFEWNARMDLGLPFAESVADLTAEFPAYASLIRVFHERWEETLGEPIQANLDLLQRIHATGRPLHALTNWSADTFPIARRLYPFLAWFQTILVSGEVSLVKPDPRIFALFLERIGKNGSECVYIDDTPANIETAKTFGMDAIPVQTPVGLEEEFRLRGLLPE